MASNPGPALHKPYKTLHLSELGFPLRYHGPRFPAGMVLGIVSHVRIAPYTRRGSGRNSARGGSFEL